MENKKIKLFELFAGIGAPRKALEYMGYEVESLGYSEINKNAIKAYCELFNDSPDNNFGDITKIEKLPDDIDILFHGSPCQDFSVAGLRKGGEENSGTRSSLMYESVRLIRQAQPKIVIWENVKAVLYVKNIKNVKRYIKALKECGYYNYLIKTNPKDIGFPMQRDRVFVVSCKEKLKLKDSGIRFICNINDIVDFETFARKGGKQFDYNVELAQQTNDITNTRNTFIYEQSVNFSKGKKKLYQDFAPCLSCRESDLIKLRFDNGELKNASYLSGKEKLELQGFPNIECVSNAQKHILAGNSINIPNLMYVYTVFGIKIQPENKINELKEIIKGDLIWKN
jgi:DNA-cytosine methyltransferase|nr:MAG TPA: Cytosine specific methyltransferase [Caudoviricetes sp.]